MRSLYQELCGISFKIAQNDFMYTKHIVSSVDSQEDIAALFSLWQKLYAEFFIRDNALDSSVYVVLDALDETFADNRLALFKMLKDVRDGGRHRFLMLGHLCSQLRTSGILAINICSQKDEWILLPPLPEAVKQRCGEQKDMVFVDQP